LGEGPHWDAATGQLYFVDLLGKGIHRYDPVTKKDARLDVAAKGEGQDATTLIVPVAGTTNKFVIGLGRSLRVLQWDGKSGVENGSNLKTLHVVADGNEGGRFNDGKCDPKGRLWAGTMGYYKSGDIGSLQLKKWILYKLENDGKISKHEDKIDISNGLCWSNDNKIMYYVDSFTYRIDAYDYDIANGTISNRRPVFDLKANNYTGIPDGMTIDVNGNLWLAVFGGGKVLHINPNTGKVLGHVELPTLNITSVAFGGANLDTLYITCAQHDLSKEQLAAQPLAGSLFQVTNTGTKGIAGVPYGGKV
jgi:sugar lactone lactonase YvrE